MALDLWGCRAIELVLSNACCRVSSAAPFPPRRRLRVYASTSIRSTCEGGRRGVPPRRGRGAGWPSLASAPETGYTIKYVLLGENRTEGTGAALPPLGDGA